MATALHDISRTQYHHPNFEGFLQDVDRATTGSFPTVAKLFRNSDSSKVYSASPYATVNVLLLSWKDDDLGVDAEIDRLQHVLENHYSYPVETWTIPSKDSHNELGDRLRQFTKSYAKENALLIVYYGGHGYLNASRQHVWLW